MGNLNIWLVFILGIIVGGVLFSKDFRQKFFRGFRRFLSGVGKSSGRGSGSQAKEPRNVPKYLRDKTPPQRDKYTPAPRNVPKPRIIDCPTCDGIGAIEEELPPLMKGAPGAQKRWTTCPICEGSGRVYEKA